jgi:anaerobic ribonucleoside-triphosphate reductase
LEGDGARFGEDVLTRLHELVKQWSADTGLPLSLRATGKHTVLERLAVMDLSHYGYPAQRVLGKRGAYSPGTAFGDRIGPESILRGLDGCEAIYPLPARGSRPEATTRTLQDAFRDSECPSISFETSHQ